MTCDAVISDSGFLATSLAHLDCQSVVIGSYGYGALADPASPVSIALGGLLTIVIALFGVRMMLGYPVLPRDGLGLVVRIGIVLTLATSWPAWRVVCHELVLDAPAELSAWVSSAVGLPYGASQRQRLQNVDDGLVTLTAYGTGRLPGGDTRDPFRGIALEDQSGFGWGRVLFLVAIIGPYAVVRLGGGIMLALAPLFAGLLLFRGASSLFYGWLRGLAFTALASLVLGISDAVGIALFEPWLMDTVARRASGAFAPAAATEMTTLALVLCFMTVGILLLVARVVFFPGVGAAVAALQFSERSTASSIQQESIIRQNRIIDGPADRARDIATSVGRSIRREEQHLAVTSPSGAAVSGSVETRDRGRVRGGFGGTYRRTYRRSTASGQGRDNRA